MKFARDVPAGGLPATLEVLEGDGVYTPGPCVSLEIGNAVELTAEDLEWLLMEAGPHALKRLRELEAVADAASA